MSKQKYIILSPFSVILIGFVTAKIAAHYLNEWAWVPLALIYWGTMLGIILVFKDKTTITSWFRKHQGKKIWIFWSILVGLIPAPILLLNLHLFDQALIIILWALFALINPFFEEMYWRGFLLDHTNHWKQWIRITYSTLLFVISHPFMWGVFSIANRNYLTFISLTLMGIIWSLTYLKSKSLRWPILSHILVDLFNMAVFVFLNLYIPPQL